MARRKRIRDQDTMIEREVYEYSGDDIKAGATEIFGALSRAYDEGGGNYGARTLQVVKIASEILEAKKALIPAKQLEARACALRLTDASGALIKGAEKMLLWDLVKGDLAAEYAFKITDLHKVILREIAANRADEAARYAVDLGDLACEARLRLGWEDLAITGKKVRAGGKKGAQGKNGSPEETEKRMRERFASYQAYRDQGLPKGEAEKRAAKDNGCSDTHSIKRARKIFEK